jgi:hypothetical protein
MSVRQSSPMLHTLLNEARHFGFVRHNSRIFWKLLALTRAPEMRTHLVDVTGRTRDRSNAVAVPELHSKHCVW